MIRINLVQKKQASYVTGGAKAAGGAGALSTLAQGGMSAVMPLLSRIGIPIALSIATSFAYDYFVQQKTDEMAQELTSLNSEKDRINKELQKIKGFESVKIELERNSLILRTKIDTIEKLVRGRDFTPKTLITLAQSTPREIWFTGVTATETSYDLKGGATDIGLVSDLMAKLSGSIYFKDINLKSTATDPTGRQSTFELSARRE